MKKPSLVRERERKNSQPESSTIAKPWCVDGGVSWSTDSIRVPDDHGYFLGSPLQLVQMYQTQVKKKCHSLVIKMICRGALVMRVLVLLLDGSQRWTLAAKV
jgi:hypothetical protein